MSTNPSAVGNVRVCQLGTLLLPPRSALTAVTRRSTPDVDVVSGGPRVDDPDANCPPVAHRLSRLGRNEFFDAASRALEEFADVAMPAVSTVAEAGDSLWRHSSSVGTPH
ncbi:hypothetical protein KM043_016317 [Ampulex compressa]|nr:hypothetical protein KM043_016317 [Ampulex compressa]